MLIVETIAKIRRYHFVEGRKIKQISRDLNISRNTVRKVIRKWSRPLVFHSKLSGPSLYRWFGQLADLSSKPNSQWHRWLGQFADLSLKPNFDCLLSEGLRMEQLVRASLLR